MSCVTYVRHSANPPRVFVQVTQWFHFFILIDFQSTATKHKIHFRKLIKGRTNVFGIQADRQESLQPFSVKHSLTYIVTKNIILHIFNYQVCTDLQQNCILNEVNKICHKMGEHSFCDSVC